MDASDDMRDDVMQLTQRLVAEADRVQTAFVALHRMHATDVVALTQVRLAEERDEQPTAGSLAKQLELTTGAVTGLVDRLERASLLHRVRDPADRRRVRLETSAAGRAVTEQLLEPVRRRSEAVLAEFTPAELAVVKRYLAATTGAMAAHRETLLGNSSTETDDEADAG